MNSLTTPILKNADEFHKWCVQKRPQDKLTALLGNWESVIGGSCNLKPVEFKPTNLEQQWAISFETDNEEKKVTVRGLQAFYQRAITMSNLQVPAAPPEGVILVGASHGYLDTLIGIIAQNRHLFGGTH